MVLYYTNDLIIQYTNSIESAIWHNQLGLGNISIYRQYRNTGVCNNWYRRLFHISIISLMQYIAEYCNILQCSTSIIGLRTQSKYASIILKIFSAVTDNTHVDDTKYQLNTLCNISNIRNVFVGNNHNTVFQYRASLQPISQYHELIVWHSLHYSMHHHFCASNEHLLVVSSLLWRLHQYH